MHVIGQPGDDRQAHVRGKLQDHAVHPGGSTAAGDGSPVAGYGTAVSGGSAASGAVTAPRCRGHASFAVRVRWGRVGHHHLEPLAVIVQRYPDRLPWAVLAVRLDRAGAGLADREAYFVKE